MAIGVLEIHHHAIRVDADQPKLDAVQNFYEGVLGLDVDPGRPTIVFAGESVMFGDGLTYEESVPAQVEGMLKIPAVNLAVYGYSTDQTYLKLREDLPRFTHPVAVVNLFMPALFGRNSSCAL